MGWRLLLGGYAVAFALKIRIIALVIASKSFPNKKLVDNYDKHDLKVLLKAAEFEEELNDDPVVS